MTAIISVSPGAQALAARQVARDFAAGAMSKSTVRTYGVAWRHFTAWCAAAGVQPLPADPVDVAAYIGSLATTHAPTTIDQRLAAIAQMHRLHGHDWQPGPAITQTRRGMLREHGRPPKKATPIRTDQVRALVETCDGTAAGVRDRALMLVGFAGALRRSEIVGLSVDDVVILPGGMHVRIGRSKTDQTGLGVMIGIPRGAGAGTCPVRAVEAWLALLGRTTGPLFRRLSKAGRLIGANPLSPCAVWDILERRAVMAGLVGALRPHGLRAGCITEAAEAGVADRDGMNHSRHKDWKTYQGYIRPVRLLDESAAGRLGL